MRLLLAGALIWSAGAAQAAYVSRFSSIANGAVTFTGNTIGLNKNAGTNAPGTSGAIGTFITTNLGSSDGTYPAGTTANWALNSSNAVLTIPAGSTVLYAELIWSGSYSYGGENVSASLGNSVTFTTPSGAGLIAPAAATSQTLGTGSAAGGCTTTPCFYVRSANVTTQVRAAGTGTYTVGGIPATQSDTDNTANTGGWTLAVAYSNGTLPSRSLSIFVGAEIGGSAAASVSGFCTPPTGPRSGRLMVSAIEGDSGGTGDQMLFGATAGTLAAVFGPRNPVGNFFASQINNDAGNTDTGGSFGTSNQTPGTSSVGRQGYDITNVDVSPSLANNQITAFAQGTTTGDQYLINALGLQINVGSPIFPATVKLVDKAVAVVGDTLTYTIKLDNSTGTADATNVVFTDAIPPGTSFVAGSVTVDGVASAGTPSAGVNVGTVVAGGIKTVVFKVTVTSIPAAPATAVYSNAAAWTYQFISCAGQPISNGSITTNPVLTNIARMATAKSVAPTGAVTPGTVLTYTVTLTNDGTAVSAGSTLQDAIPAGATYVAGSTTLNGTAVADVAGVMPFVAARLVNSAGQAAGVLAVGQSAAVVFRVTVNNNGASPITNTASGDIDGAGAAPSSTATASNAFTPIASVGISKTNGVAELVTGAASTYALTISNGGPSDANGTTVQDAVVAGLNCTAVTCTLLTGAAACPAGPIAMTTFQSAPGLPIPALPANSSVRLDVQCIVTASGQ